MDRRAFGLAVAGLGAGVLLGGRALAEEPAVDLTGRWEGRVLLASGHELRVETTLAADGARRWTGTWTATQLDEEGPGRPTAGRLEVTRTADGVEASAALQGRPVTFKARLADAGTHAEKALLGTVEGEKLAGVALLFRYRG